MKVFNVGPNQIAYTGAVARRTVNTFSTQIVEPMMERGGRALLNELTDCALHPIGAKGDAELNSLYKRLPADALKKIKNFDGFRKEYVFRGKDYLNKVIEEISSPPLTFVRSMKNVGTNDNPIMKTTAMSLRNPVAPEEIFVDFLEEGEHQFFLRVAREGFEMHRALYKNWDELTKDSVFLRIAKVLTGEDY